MVEKGLSKYWTPEQADKYRRILDACDNFGERHLIMTIYGSAKYDLRTRAGRRVQAQARLRLATATDEELEELAILVAQITGAAVAERLQRFKNIQTKIRETGINKTELQYRSR